MNKYTNTGGAAFPTTDFTHAGQIIPGAEGMSLRDYFAAKAMQGMVCKLDDGMSYEQIAEDAHVMADAMLKARAA